MRPTHESHRPKLYPETIKTILLSDQMQLLQAVGRHRTSPPQLFSGLVICCALSRPLVTRREGISRPADAAFRNASCSRLLLLAKVRCILPGSTFTGAVETRHS